jgi:hypothetical protein
VSRAITGRRPSWRVVPLGPGPPASLADLAQVRHALSAARKPRCSTAEQPICPPVQPPLGHTKIESTVRYLGIEIDVVFEIAEKSRSDAERSCSAYPLIAAEEPEPLVRGGSAMWPPVRGCGVRPRHCSSDAARTNVICEARLPARRASGLCGASSNPSHGRHRPRHDGDPQPRNRTSCGMTGSRISRSSRRWPAFPVFCPRAIGRTRGQSCCWDFPTTTRSKTGRREIFLTSLWFIQTNLI